MPRFQKGQTGNPKGRPRGPSPISKQTLKRLHGTDVEGLFAHLEALMRGDNERISFEASKLLLAYRLGTPTQRVEMTGANGGPMQFEDARDKFSARIATLAARVPTSDSAERTH